MKTIGALLAVLLAPVWAMGAAGESLEEIAARHAREMKSIRTGRLTFTVERYMPESIKWALREVPEADLPARMKIEEAHTNGTFTIDYIFDMDSRSHKRRAVSAKTLEELVAETALGPAAGDYLSRTLVESDIGAKRTSYGLEANMVHILEGAPYHHMFEKDITPVGFFLMGGELMRAGAQGEIADDPSDSNMLVAKFTMGNTRIEFLLDKSFNYRYKRWAIYENDRLTTEYKLDYRKWGEHIFPATYENSKYDAEGNLTRHEKYTFSSVELNVPIDPSEFDVDYPADAEVRRSYDFWETRPEFRRAEEQEAVEELVTAPRDGQTGAAGQTAQAPVEPVTEPPAGPPETPAPEAAAAADGTAPAAPRRWAKIAVIVAAVALLIALIIVAARKRS